MRRLKSRLLALGLLVLGIGLAPLPAAEAACSISECMGSCVYEEPQLPAVREALSIRVPAALK
jgi:hypothetical protein